MSEKDKNKQEAAEHAARAARQMKHAASNAGDAAEAAAGYVKNEVVEDAEKAKNRVQDLASKAFYTETGRGVMAIGIGIISIGLGIKQIQNARQIRKVS